MADRGNSRLKTTFRALRRVTFRSNGRVRGPGINAAVIEAVERGIVGSCSVMTTCPGTAEALALLRGRPHLSVGVHLTLVRDSARLRWEPLTNRQRVPSLVDETGDLFLATRSSELLGRARLPEVELELRAQIHAVLDAGLAPTHLDWHCLADGGPRRRVRADARAGP